MVFGVHRQQDFEKAQQERSQTQSGRLAVQATYGKTFLLNQQQNARHRLEVPLSACLSRGNSKSGGNN